MDKDYWENFYKNYDGNVEPSLFSKFVLENYAKANNHLIELGCGNGRDAIFLLKKD